MHSNLFSLAPLVLNTGDNEKISRLVNLCKVWGTIKYAHPHLQYLSFVIRNSLFDYRSYKPIDWDGALLDVLPLVSKAKSPADHRAAIQQMLRKLEDPTTRVFAKQGFKYFSTVS